MSEDEIATALRWLKAMAGWLAKEGRTPAVALELARIGAATKAAAERDGAEREAMAASMWGHPANTATLAQAAAAALVGLAKGESDGQGR